MLNLTDGGAESLPKVLADLASVRHVYVGEVHLSDAHHAVQLEVAERLQDSGAEIVLAIEWLPGLTQPALDAWTAGELTEAVFLERVQWGRFWGHPFDGYRPIFHWARANRVRIVALNPPPGLAEAVRRGGPEGVPASLRGALPPLDSANDAHRRYFFERMAEAGRAHGHGHSLGPAVLERYYQAQLVRDETMAAGVARLVAESPRRVVVVLAGAGHVDFAHGIPVRAAKSAGPFRIVLPVEAGKIPEAAREVTAKDYPDRRADYAWEAPRVGGVFAHR